MVLQSETGRRRRGSSMSVMRSLRSLWRRPGGSASTRGAVWSILRRGRPVWSIFRRRRAVGSVFGRGRAVRSILGRSKFFVLGGGKLFILGNRNSLVDPSSTLQLDPLLLVTLELVENPVDILLLLVFRLRVGVFGLFVFRVLAFLVLWRLRVMVGAVFLLIVVFAVAMMLLLAIVIVRMFAVLLSLVRGMGPTADESFDEPSGSAIKTNRHDKNFDAATKRIRNEEGLPMVDLLIDRDVGSRGGFVRDLSNLGSLDELPK